MGGNDQLTVGEVCRRSGFPASALRYYEAQGLVEAARTPGGQRRYRRSVLRRLAFVRAATHVGLSLEEVRVELARLPQGRTPTAADWRRISASWRGRLEEQIEALERLRDDLDSCIGCGCLSLARCGVANPGDGVVVGAQPPGAAYLPPLLRRPAPAAGSAGRG